jgi:hypothetical protein
MLVVPMTGDKGGTIGVLQLINAMDGERTVPFPAEIVQPISALASQAAACIQNMRYAGQVTALLDSLVDALTAAIDDRTPYNANHSRNMARCAERFLAWAGRNDPAWRRTEDEVRAFVLSVRLHDVGKLVTPLSVMNKEDRLGDRLPRMEERFRRMDLLDRIAALEGRITEEQRRKQTLERGEAMERIRRMNSAEFLSPEDAQWAEELLYNHPEFNADNAMDIIHAEVGAVFEQVLCDAGVFKRDEAGQAAFGRFIQTITE